MAEQVTDPVCGMTVSTDAAAASAEYGGTTYYFCSDYCHKQFLKDPAAYASG